MDRPSLRASRKALVLALLVSLVGLSACTAGDYAFGESIANAISAVIFTEVCEPVAVPDGAGGVYAAYEKNVQGLARIAYLQRLDADGKPLWPGTGPKIYLERVPGYNHLRIPVGELVPTKDGVILVWFLGSRVWAQKVDSAGNLLWGKQGVKLGISLLPSIGGGPGMLRAVSDGAGGVVIAAYAGPPAGITLDRLDASGKSVWSEGRRLADPSSMPSVGDHLDLASDAAGDFFVWWSRSTSWGLQKLNAQGEFQWGPEGITPFPPMSGFSCEHMVADGAGGAFVLCSSQTKDTDSSGKKQSALVAQHFDPQGKPLWPESGLVLAIPPEEWHDSAMVPDGAGGAVVAWQQYGGSVSAQRVNAQGQLLWGDQSVKVSYGGFLSLAPGHEPGEALVAWDQSVSKARNVYVVQFRAQKLSEDGALVWGPSGMTFTTLEPASGSAPLIVADGEGGAFVTWTVGGSRGGHHNDTTYIQHIAADGRPLWGAQGIQLTALR